MSVYHARVALIAVMKKLGGHETDAKLLTDGIEELVRQIIYDREDDMRDHSDD